MKRSSSQMNVPVLLKHVCGDSRIVVLLAVSVVLCFFSVVFMTKALVLSPQQVDFEHIQFHSRHREECEHRERVTTRSLEKVLGDLLSCKEDLHVTAGNNSDVQGRPAGASQVRRELRGGRDCTKALRTVLTEKESLQDAISTFHLREKASQLQIDTLQSTLHKSEFYKAKKWVKGKVALQDAPQEKPFGMYVYDMPKFNVDFFNSHETEYQTECKNQIGERHIHQLFENSPHRVMDGEVADLYFVPVYTGCYRSVMGRELQMDAYNATFNFIQEAMDVVKQQPYWARSQGKDHVWMFLYDYGVCLEYAQSFAKNRQIPPGLENSIFVGYVGDNSAGHSCFSTWKDLPIPAYVTNPAITAGRGGVATDPDKRTTLVHFRGSVTWPLSEWHTREMNYSHGVRDLINRTYYDDPLFRITQGSTPDYVREIETSTFCLTPLGYSLWSFRFYESVMLGCIPVIIADHIEMPFEDMIDYRSFSVKILESQVVNLKDILLGIPLSEIRRKQAMLGQVWRQFAYNNITEPGDAFDTLIQKLKRKVQPMHPLGLAYYQ